MNFQTEEKLTWAGIVIAIVIFVAVLCGAVADHNRLMKACMDDGHPEYYCRGLLDGRHP